MEAHLLLPERWFDVHWRQYVYQTEVKVAVPGCSVTNRSPDLDFCSHVLSRLGQPSPKAGLLQLNFPNGTWRSGNLTTLGASIQNFVDTMCLMRKVQGEHDGLIGLCGCTAC